MKSISKIKLNFILGGNEFDQRIEAESPTDYYPVSSSNWVQSPPPRVCKRRFLGICLRWG
jgi:hypothetical protein